MGYKSRGASRSIIAGIVGFALVAAATVASADSLGTVPQNTHTFTLDSASGARVLDSRTPRELRVCNQTGRTSSTLPQQGSLRVPLAEQRALAEGTAMSPTALEVTHSGKTDVIQPGECHRVLATQVRIRSVASVPADQPLVGTIAWVSPESAPPAGLADRAASDSAGRATASDSAQAMIADMQASLEQSDQTIQEATRQLDRAQRDLETATRHMREASAAGNGATRR